MKTRSASGDPTTIWEAVAIGIYASVEPLHGQELWHASQIMPLVTHQVRMRFMPGLTSDMRVVHRGRYLNIAFPPINDCDRDIELKLMCIEQEA